MTIHVNIGEAKTRLSELVAASLRGEEVVLNRAGKPVARIVGLAEAAELDRAARQAERAAQWDAFIGSKAGLFPDTAEDYLLEPAFTDAELDEFDKNDLI
jgi:prevent-host-death family protein